MRSAAPARASQAPRSAHGLAERVRRHVAEPLRDLLLEVGPRELQHARITLGDLEIAGEFRARALDAADAVGVQQAQQIERRRAQRRRRGRRVGIEPQPLAVGVQHGASSPSPSTCTAKLVPFKRASSSRAAVDSPTQRLSSDSMKLKGENLRAAPRFPPSG